MKNVLILYQSKTGVTRQFAEAVGKYISEKNLESTVIPIQEYKKEMLDQYDAVMLGCWTAGLMILMQTPDKPWKAFVQQLPDLGNKNVALFTTYKLATGSMFKKMRKYIGQDHVQISLELKSRNRKIHSEHMQLIDAWIR